MREIIGLAPSKDPVVLTMKKDYSHNYVVQLKENKVIEHALIGLTYK